MPVSRSPGGTSLSRNPLAPARSAAKTYSSRLNVVSIRMRAADPDSTICRVASMPSITGMRTSISTTSGSNAWVIATPWTPSPASPTTSRSGWVSSTIRKPSSSSGWSSTSNTRVVMYRLRRRSAGWLVRANRRRRAVRTVVADLQVRAVVAVAQPNLRAGLRPGVLEGVGERLLHDAVDGEPGPGPPRSWYAFGGQRDPHAGCADLFHQRVEVAQPRLGRASGVVIVEHAEQAPHLGQRLPAGRGDLVHRVGGALGRARCGERCAVGQGDDHGQVVRHDVVHVPGDAGPLGRGGEL